MKRSYRAIKNSLKHFQIYYCVLEVLFMAPVLISPPKVGHIDDVQELTKTKTRNIPERFVRDVNERPELSDTKNSPCDMPIIDFSKFLNGNTEDLQVEIMNLASACEEWGFFQV